MTFKRHIWHMLLGLSQVAEGLTAIVTLGFYHPAYAIWMLKHATWFDQWEDE